MCACLILCSRDRSTWLYYVRLVDLIFNLNSTHTGRLYAQFWSMLLLFGVHMLRGTSICWSLFRAGRLDGYVAAVGSQLIHHGHFHPVIAALNLTFPLYKSDVIIYLYASSMISIINIPHFHLTSFVISTQCHLEVTTSH